MCIRDSPYTARFRQTGVDGSEAAFGDRTASPIDGYQIALARDSTGQRISGPGYRGQGSRQGLRV